MKKRNKRLQKAVLGHIQASQWLDCHQAMKQWWQMVAVLQFMVCASILGLGWWILHRSGHWFWAFVFGVYTCSSIMLSVGTGIFVISQALSNRRQNQQIEVVNNPRPVHCPAPPSLVQIQTSDKLVEQAV